ncbi:acetyl-CoA hydrolase/transferase family protein [Pseudobacteriovorax antillogorgiicola]|uniref:Acyl-CoA hydrolase n=1 Tax=Pseudobacteriovorax antillogorgiicola TaxID=1513793 RepID=A0A1Y6BE94_9BACT|nr:acetyl-CoA hydrolase/transferase C-terminal domain-containing protein [Pseudobacteriovorax antillogorgiicola]TCS56429.1 acyl-CoA hydrolase [Pseudobacteriovorax antillogorgiicola]SMF05602.1 Acyl-CoA hydrolase [Pseudobacteriovorax antillogorgiicola]
MKQVDIASLKSLIAESNRIVTGMAAAEPQQFYSFLSEHSELIGDGKTLYCANPSRAYGCFQDEGFDQLQVVVMFLTSAVRKLSGKRVQYFPHHLSQWAGHLTKRGIDLFWGSCSLPDDRGFVSLGPSCCYESEVIARAKHVVLEVNPHIPMTYGSTTVRLEDVDYLVESHQELPEVQRASITETDEKIARHIAALIPDGATLQLGIGSIPNAIGKALADKQDLGIHTEMINDTMMDLYCDGVVTGRKKTRWPGKLVGSFAYGSRKLYDFIDKNPLVELHPASVVNDPYRLGKNHKMMSINTAVEIDITGQVCSESVGHRELSGVGGASETHIGAQRSPEGRGIIAMHARAKNGQSKIVFELQPGAKVSISRNDIDTVVTEFGVAQLKGMTVRERALALIDLAHPDVRAELLESCRKAGYI